MSIVKKDIKYLNKDFGTFRNNLINFAKNYFPDTYSDFNESSPGMMFVEMASYVGDVLSYYSDQSFRESMLSLAQEDSNVLLLGQLFGFKGQLNSPAQGSLDVFQLLPAIGTGDNARPDWRYALNVQAGMQCTSDSDVTYRTLTGVNFGTSGSNDATDVSVYEIDSSGNVQFYLLKKTVPIESGEVVTYDVNFSDPKPYDKIILPETNVIDIISIVDNLGNTWHEVDYLAQDTIFEDVLNTQFQDETLSEYKSTVPYILKLKRSARRWVKKLTDENKFEISFGAGVSSDEDEELIPNPKNVGMGLEYLKRTTTTSIDPTNFLRTKTYGLAPDNVTLTITYTVGGGLNDNSSVNTINNISEKVIQSNAANSQVDLAFVESSLAVNNPLPVVGGREKDDLESLRQNAMASFAAQSRAITREDYITRCYAMPKKYGSVAKAYIIGDTQQNSNDKTYPRETISNPMALNLYTLGYDINKNFVPCNPAIRENLRTYLSNFRMLTDAISIKTAHIINIGVNFDIIPRPKYNSNEVLLRCIDLLKRLLSNDNMQINAPINLANLQTELDKVEGVQSVARFEITNLFSLLQGYSGNLYDIPGAIRNNILYPSLDPSIFEVKNPDGDIKGRIVKN